jgi:hypothetical protein
MPVHPYILMSVIVIEGRTKQAGLVLPKITDRLIISDSPSYERVLSIADRRNMFHQPAPKRF